jgi:hypothetical protein
MTLTCFDSLRGGVLIQLVVCGDVDNDMVI